MYAKALAFWLYSLMLWLSPLQVAVEQSQLDAWSRETFEQRDDRYREIGKAIADVVTAPGARLPFRGPSAVSTTAAMLLAIAWTESGLRRDIDVGKGPRSRGQGKDSCLTQIRVGRGRTSEGWSHADLTSDYVKCFTASLHLATLSFGACRTLPARYSLTAYAAGNCTSVAGRKNSAAKLGVMYRLLSRTAPPSSEEPTAALD